MSSTMKDAPKKAPKFEDKPWSEEKPDRDKKEDPDKPEQKENEREHEKEPGKQKDQPPDSKEVAVPLSIAAPVTKSQSGPGTHLSGNIFSGQGVVPLQRRVDFDYTQAPIDWEILFPVGSIVTQVISATNPAFNGTTPQAKVGTASGGAQVATLDLTLAFAKANPAAQVPASGKLYLGVTLTGTTAGKGTVLINYSRP